MKNLDPKIKELYANGIVNFKEFFSRDLLLKIKSSKDKLFNEFPFGQDDKLQKNKKNEFIRPGSHMIWDVIDREPLFKEFILNENVDNIARRVLGENYVVSSFYIRKTPKSDNVLSPHIDYQGGLSFSILLDDISHNEGETFFYKKSHKLPPPPFTDLENKDLKKEISSSTGKLGDTFFWFPDCWHGRNMNKSNKETTILMCHMGNASFPRKDGTGREVYYTNNIKPLDMPNQNPLIKFIFKITGKSPNNFFKHLFYCLFYFKFKGLAAKAIKQKIIFTREKFGSNEVDEFSLISYLRLIKLKKLIKISLSSFLKTCLGNKNYSNLRKILN